MLLGLTVAFLIPDFEDVFVSGRMDATVPFDTFRIPALARTPKGTLLAFAEARKSVNDQSANVLVLRRKTAKAKTWSPIQIVQRDEPNALNNPCVLATRDGRVALMYQRYPAGLNERTTLPGLDPNKSCRTFILWSQDDGISWGTAQEITAAVKGKENQSDASGPGIGIELTRGKHKGRLLFPFNEGLHGSYDVFGVYSDDHGKTWQRGTVAPKAPGTQPNETQVVELADGSILMNARNQASVRERLQCRSLDGGITWDTATLQPNLPDPVCMGSIVRLSFKPDLIAFSNARDTKTRRQGTLRLSNDGGLSWPKSQTLVPGSFAYSCLCPLPGGKVGILFESVDTLPDGREGYRIKYGVVDVDHIGIE